MNHGDTASSGQETTRESKRAVRVLIDRRTPRQVFTAFGGNFAVARFGDRDAQDAVGGYVLNNLPVGHARVGIPLKTFIKLSGDNYDAGHTSIKDIFWLMEQFRDRKIPVVATIWDVPDFCMTDPEATTGRRIAPDKRDKVIAAVAEWLRLGRERHGLTVPYVSFNAPDGGGLIDIPADDMRYFITRGGAAFEKMGLPTKCILGDTTSGQALAPYITAVMADKSVVPYIGPVAFHASDSLSASDDTYLSVAKAARLYRKPVWCLEAGYDARPGGTDTPAWDTWEHALKLAHSYVRCLTLAEASVIDYWQYQNDNPIAGGAEGDAPYPAFHVLKMFARTFPADTQIVSAKVIGEGIYVVAGFESEAQKLRALLVNTGGPTEVAVGGGPPGMTYLSESIDPERAELLRSGGSSDPDTTTRESDEKGFVTVSMPANSVSALSEQ